MNMLLYCYIVNIKILEDNMKNIIKNEKYGEIIFEENFWTGKKNIVIDGKPLTKVDKTTYKTEDDKTVSLSGNFLYGCKMTLEGETIELSPAVKWYEYVLSFLPFVLIMVWGNISALCQIVPVVGGAIGGFVSAIFCCVNLFIIKKFRQWWLKLIISIITLGLTFLVCYLIALAILAVM